MGLRFEALDTNLIMRVILNDVPSQVEKVYELLDSPMASFYVPDLAITEIVYNLAGDYYQWDRESIVNGVGGFLRIPHVEHNKALFDKVFETYLRHPKLSFNDCYLAAHVAERGRMPIWTLDKAFARQAGEAKLLG